MNATSLLLSSPQPLASTEVPLLNSSLLPSTSPNLSTSCTASPSPADPTWVGLGWVGSTQPKRVERRWVVSPAPLHASTSRSFSLRIWRKKRKNNGQKSCVRAGQTGVNPPSKWIPGCRCARGVASPLPLHNASLGGAAQKEMVKLLIMALKENMLHLLWIAVQN